MDNMSKLMSVLENVIFGDGSMAPMMKELTAAVKAEGRKIPTAEDVERAHNLNVIKATPAAGENAYDGSNNLIVKDGVKVAKGYKAPVKVGGGVKKEDPVKDQLNDFVRIVLMGKFPKAEQFISKSEGYVISFENVDYAIKVSKSKAPKYDVTDSADVDFATRGKAKNYASDIAKAIYSAFNFKDDEAAVDERSYTLALAKASGIVLHTGAADEYTIKISKKRDRVYRAE